MRPRQFEPRQIEPQTGLERLSGLRSGCAAATIAADGSGIPTASSAVPRTPTLTKPEAAGGAIIAPADPLTHARSMSAEQLGEHIRKELKPLCTKLASLRPYIQAAFEKMAAGEAVCGYKSKKQFCRNVLGPTYNAVKFMLRGGNPRNRKRQDGGRPKHLTPLEHKLLGTAAAVHEALAAIRAGRIEDAVRTLSENAPAQDRIEEYLQRGTKPSMANPEGRAGSAAEKLAAALAAEPDCEVASRMLSEHLRAYAERFVGQRVEVSVQAAVAFAGRGRRIMPGDWLERGSENCLSGARALGKCTGIAEGGEARVIEWDAALRQWCNERAISGREEQAYRVVTEAGARRIAPEAFPSGPQPRANRLNALQTTLALGGTSSEVIKRLIAAPKSHQYDVKALRAALSASLAAEAAR